MKMADEFLASVERFCRRISTRLSRLEMVLTR